MKKTLTCTPALVPLLAMLVACDSSSPPTSPPPPAFTVPHLESIDFDLVGAGKIAFERIGPLGADYVAVYVVDATARTSTHIFDNSVTFGPALSPDGRQVAFTRYTNSTSLYDVYVARIDGTLTQAVTAFPQQEGPVSWTTDAAKIVVAAGASGSTFYDIYSQSPIPNAPDQARLSHFTLGQGGLLECPIIFGNDIRVSISSQGMMAFACNVAEIDVLRADGTFSAAYRPSRDDRTHWQNLFAAEWSPDGTKVAFIETVSNQQTDFMVSSYALKVMSADGTNVTTIASIPLATSAKVQPGGGWIGPNNFSVCWMPDGSRLVFSVPETSLVGHLWVVRADGSGLAQLTSAAGVYDRSVSCSRS